MLLVSVYLIALARVCVHLDYAEAQAYHNFLNSLISEADKVPLDQYLVYMVAIEWITAV